MIPPTYMTHDKEIIPRLLINTTQHIYFRYYLTANSCYHDGYLQYNWPTGWDTGATSSGVCEDVSVDGTGVPGQFWNCAEVRILAGTAPSSSITIRNNVLGLSLLSLFAVFW